MSLFSQKPYTKGEFDESEKYDFLNVGKMWVKGVYLSIHTKIF